MCLTKDPGIRDSNDIGLWSNKSWTMFCRS